MPRIDELGLKQFRASGFNDNRVLLQGFYWESYRHGHTDKPLNYGSKRWYEIVKDNAEAIRDGRFDLIWLPPVCFSGDYSAGYNPKHYFDFSNSYGSRSQHREMLEKLLLNGIEPVADVVINHRDGTRHWADFTKPTWDLSTISRDDEFFTNMDNAARNINLLPQNIREQFTNEKLREFYGDDYLTTTRGFSEPYPDYVSHGGKSYHYKDFRDIDHDNPKVKEDILRYLLSLRTFGYRGWRYDMVHGFLADTISFYNKMTTPSFSVGEFDWGAHDDQRGWVWHSATENKNLETASNIFDFTSLFTLKDNLNQGNYLALYGFGNGIGMVGDTTDGHPWKNRAVTFLENHDTGYRTREDGKHQHGHQFDSFANNWQIEQGYAYILTHPGIPSVYWKHYFDWGNDLHNKIKSIINARKVAGIHAGSTVHHQSNAYKRGVYAAKIDGNFGEIFVRIGGSDNEWQPFYSNYHDYREYAYGAGWKVWVRLSGNPRFRFAPLKGAFPIPQFFEASEIQIN